MAFSSNALRTATALAAPALTTAALALVIFAASCTKDSAEQQGEPESASKPSVALTAEPVAVEKQVAKAEMAGDCAGAAEVAAEGGESECKKSELGCNQWDAEAAAVLEKKVPGDADWKTFSVTGMTCGGCERKVIAKLGKIDGIVGVEADAELGQVRFATSPKSPKAVKNAREALDGLYKITGEI